MKRLGMLFAAGALAVPLVAQAQTTGGQATVGSTSASQATTNGTTNSNTTATQGRSVTQGTGASNAAPVFTMSGAGRLVDQYGNVLTQIGTGQFTDQRGNVFTVDGKGRVVDQTGNVVSAPGVVVGTGQSTVTATVPTLPGLANQTMTLGPGVGASTTQNAPTLQTTSQNLSLTPGLALTPGTSNPALGTASVGTSGIVSGQVVSVNPGGNLTIRQANGLQVSFPVGGVALPANLRPGRDVTVFTDQSTPGIVQVTGVSAGTLTAQPATSRTLTGTRGGGTIKLASGRSVNVGGGTASTGTAVRGEVVTVQSFNGSTLTVLQPNGRTVTLRVNSASSLPSNLSSGSRVVLTTRTVNGVSYVNTISMATSS